MQILETQFDAVTIRFKSYAILRTVVSHAFSEIEAKILFLDTQKLI